MDIQTNVIMTNIRQAHYMFETNTYHVSQLHVTLHSELYGQLKHIRMIYSNHVTSSKRVYTLICHNTMHRNSINFQYNSGHVTLWCLEVVPVVYPWVEWHMWSWKVGQGYNWMIISKIKVYLLVLVVWGWQKSYLPERKIQY